MFIGNIKVVELIKNINKNFFLHLCLINKIENIYKSIKKKLYNNSLELKKVFS